MAKFTGRLLLILAVLKGASFHFDVLNIRVYLPLFKKRFDLSVTDAPLVPAPEAARSSVSARTTS